MIAKEFERYLFPLPFLSPTLSLRERGYLHTEKFLYRSKNKLTSEHLRE